MRAFLSFVLLAVVLAAPALAQPVQIKLAQSAVFDGKRVVYLAGRQVQWHVVR